ncbi:hypothetical protein D3C78_1014380 [compost metagenome]
MGEQGSARFGARTRMFEADFGRSHGWRRTKAHRRVPLDKRVSRRYPTSVGRISVGEDLWCYLPKRAGLSKVTRPCPKGGRNPIEGRTLVSHAAKPHQGASRWLGDPARVCRRGADYFLRCNALRLLHPTVFHYVAKPRHHNQSASVRIRCAIRTYDSMTPGDYGFPHPDPVPRGEGTKTL